MEWTKETKMDASRESTVHERLIPRSRKGNGSHSEVVQVICILFS